MSSKRNWLSRSSSRGEVATMMSPIDAWKQKRPATNSRINATHEPVNVLPQKSGQQPTMINKWHYSAAATAAMVHEPDQKHGKSTSIWTLMDDEEEDRKDHHQVDVVDESFGAFYQACALCKKKLPLTVNFFMYGYLQAFCSNECRDAKIAVDSRFKTPSPQRSTASTSSKPGNSSASRAAANGYGSKGKRTESARFK